MKLSLAYQGSIIIITVIILFANIFISIENGHIISLSYAHLGGKVQQWTDVKDNVRIQFSYSPEMPIIDTFTALNFSVQDLKTGEHIKDLTARVVVTNGQRLFKFENITVPHGDFSVKYLFPDDGTHQVILRLDSKNIIELASFNVFVPHQSPPGLLTYVGYPINIVIAIGIIGAVGLITIIILKRK